MLEKSWNFASQFLYETCPKNKINQTKNHKATHDLFNIFRFDYQHKRQSGGRGEFARIIGVLEVQYEESLSFFFSVHLSVNNNQLFLHFGPGVQISCVT